MTTVKMIDQMPKNGRKCNPLDLIRQIGNPTVAAISGGRFAVWQNEHNEATGLTFPIARSRNVLVVLGYNDTYSVYRFRKIVSGANKGKLVVEFEQHDVYCDQIDWVSYNASNWQ